MSETRTIMIPWRTVTANLADPSDNGFTPVSDWFDIAGLEGARCSVDVRNLTGLMELIGAIQLADHPRDGSPTATNLGSTWADADGFVDASTFTDLSSAAGGAQVARNSDTSVLSSCEVEGTWDLTMKKRLADVVLDWDPCIHDRTAASFFPATEWMDTLPTRAMRAVVELRSKTGNFAVRPGYQLADDVENPDSPVALGSVLSADGMEYPTTWQSVGTPKRKLRFGWILTLTSGGTTAYGTVRARIQRLTE